MSSTNRGLERLTLDQYDSPPWLIKAFLPHIIPRQHLSSEPYAILEPSAGKGNIIDVIKEYPFKFPYTIDAIDIEPRMEGCWQADFLTLDITKKFDLIVGNPPFSLMLDFVKKALTLRKTVDSTVGMLGRLNWLGSQKRAKWMRVNKPNGLYITPKRPMFRLNKQGKLGSDSTEYCWFVWGSPSLSGIHIIETEDIE